MVAHKVHNLKRKTRKKKVVPSLRSEGCGESDGSFGAKKRFVAGEKVCRPKVELCPFETVTSK